MITVRFSFPSRNRGHRITRTVTFQGNRVPKHSCIHKYGYTVIARSEPKRHGHKKRLRHKKVRCRR